MPPPLDSPELEEVTRKFAWLNFAHARGDLQSCVTLLQELKVLLTKFRSLPPSFEKTRNAAAELKIARAIYEHAVFLNVKLKDNDAVERDFHQLKSFYNDTCGLIDPSPDEYPILGINLMRLLAKSRIAEFHTELELLPLNALDHPCIKYAVELENSFMAGTYNQFDACQAVPHETYVYLMDLLAETTRDEIADCSSQAYDYLSLSDARKMLMLSSDHELLKYISEKQPEWKVENCSVLFHTAKSEPRTAIPSFQMIKRALSYAEELEHII